MWILGLKGLTLKHMHTRHENKCVENPKAIFEPEFLAICASLFKLQFAMHR